MSETPVWFIAASLIAFVVFFVFDVLVAGRRPHIPSAGECARHIAFFVGAALVFGALMWLVAGVSPALEFYSGWLTEYSLSIDNLFVFVLIMANFAVPKELQKLVLSVGIAVALVLRGVCIVLGAAVIERFTWVFFLFGAVLLVSAVKLVCGLDDGGEEYHDNAAIRGCRRVLRLSGDYEGSRLRVCRGGVWYWTPLLVVFVAIGTTDVLFACDSIPAIFGLTKDPFIVFATNVFALLGLKQLYFLLGALLDRLVYLPLGLSVVLGFIGVKLVLEALAGNTLPFINGGRPVSWVPEIPTWLSLTVIVLSLTIASLASLWTMRTAQSEV